jgi:hypothetical protein
MNRPDWVDVFKGYNSQDRLLVFHVDDGWDPLCRFLELSVPVMPFPHRHPKKEFWEHFGEEPL